jgi:hypothetical protein
MGLLHLINVLVLGDLLVGHDSPHSAGCAGPPDSESGVVFSCPQSGGSQFFPGWMQRPYQLEPEDRSRNMNLPVALVISTRLQVAGAVQSGGTIKRPAASAVVRPDKVICLGD